VVDEVKKENSKNYAKKIHRSSVGKMKYLSLQEVNFFLISGSYFYSTDLGIDVMFSLHCNAPYTNLKIAYVLRINILE
jgi:hypothetical protein